MIRALHAWPLALLVGFGCGTDSTAPDVPPPDALLATDGSSVAATILVQPFMVFHFLPDDVDVDQGAQTVCLTGATAADGVFVGATFTGCQEVLVVRNGSQGGPDVANGSGGA